MTGDMNVDVTGGFGLGVGAARQARHRSSNDSNAGSGGVSEGRS